MKKLFLLSAMLFLFVASGVAQLRPPYSVTVSEIDKGSKEQVTLDVVFDIPEQIHVFVSEEQFFGFDVSESQGLGKPVLTLPALEKYTDLLGETSDVQTVRVVLPYTEAKGSEWILKGSIGSQGCNDSTCFAPRNDAFSLKGIIPEGAIISQAEPDNTEPVEAGSDEPTLKDTKKAVSADVNNLGFEYQISEDNSNDSGGIGLILKYMIFAFLGGLVLNFMPCVLPVLSIKAMSIVNSAHQDRKEIFKGAMAYTAGILTSFIVLAALVIAAQATGQAAGWGDHMQNPVFVVILFILIWVFSLSLFDVFSMGSCLPNLHIWS
jgi:thiol:disulfide interchange protein